MRSEDGGPQRDRRHRRHRLLASLALGGALLALAGCSGSAPDAAPLDDTAAGSDELTGTLTVSAAASLQTALEQLIPAFTEEHPGVAFASTSFDGSSVLATQILGGAPADVFASADERNMDRVVEAGLTASDPLVFATSRLEIAVAPGNPLGIETLADLATPDASGHTPLVVICQPEVPCGAAAHQLLDRDAVKLTPASEEQNVTAVLTKVREGEADAGLVYRSDVLSAEGAVDGIAILGASEAAGAYVVAPLAGSASPDAARAFAESLRSDDAQELFDELGFGPAP